MLSGGAVSWKSQLQRSVAVSTTESEIVAASEGTKELIWLKRLMFELTNRSEPITLFVDKASAVKLAKNPEFHSRTKHIQIHHYFVRGKFLEGHPAAEHIDGQSQSADIMTKALDRVRFQFLRQKIGVDC